MDSSGVTLLLFTAVPGLILTGVLLSALVLRGPTRRRPLALVLPIRDLAVQDEPSGLDVAADAVRLSVQQLADTWSGRIDLPVELFVAVESTASVGLDEGPTLGEALMGTINHPPGPGEVGVADGLIREALTGAPTALADLARKAGDVIRDRPYGHRSGITGRAMLAGTGPALGLPDGVPVVLSPALADAVRADPRSSAPDDDADALLRAMADGVRRMEDAVRRIDELAERYRAEADGPGRERACDLVDLVRRRPMITVDDVVDAFEVSPRIARRHLRRAVERGWLFDAGVHGPQPHKQWLAPEIIQAAVDAFDPAVDLRERVPHLTHASW